MNTRVAVYEQVAERVKDYPLGVGRLQISRDFGVGKSTAIEHLEKCVKRGILVKSFTWINRTSRGWVYYSPDNLPRLEIPDHKWDSGIDETERIPQGLTPAEEEQFMNDGLFAVRGA